MKKTQTIPQPTTEALIKYVNRRFYITENLSDHAGYKENTPVKIINEHPHNFFDVRDDFGNTWHVGEEEIKEIATQPTTVRELPEQPLRYLQNKRGDFINMNGMDICEVLTMKGAMGAELVRRYNIYPELLTALKDIVHGDQVGMGKKAMDLRFDIANDLIEKIEAV